MKIAGKSPPESEELEKTVERGLEHVELYLERCHLDNFEQSLENCENTEINICSIHTPHVGIEEKDYFRKADKLAQKLDAKLVFHSKKILHTAIPEIEKLDLDSTPVFENQPGASVRHLKQTILDQNRKLTLDTAHLYMAEKNYIEKIADLLQNYREQIEVIHLCDSTPTKDGVGFRKGEMEMKEMCQIIYESKFDGIVVLEVMPEEQEEALEKFKNFVK